MLEVLTSKALHAEGKRRLTEKDIENMKFMIREMRRAYEKTGIASDTARRGQKSCFEEDADNADVLAWIEGFIDHMNIQSLNREAVEELIDRIEVFEGKRIVIHFRFGSDSQEIQKRP